MVLNVTSVSGIVIDELWGYSWWENIVPALLKLSFLAETVTQTDPLVVVASMSWRPVSSDGRLETSCSFRKAAAHELPAWSCLATMPTASRGPSPFSRVNAWGRKREVDRRLHCPRQRPSSREPRHQGSETPFLRTPLPFACISMWPLSFCKVIVFVSDFPVPC